MSLCYEPADCTANKNKKKGLGTRGKYTKEKKKEKEKGKGKKKKGEKTFKKTFKKILNHPKQVKLPINDTKGEHMERSPICSHLLRN